MSRTKRICIFFCVLAVFGCSAYYAGYQYTQRAEQKKISLETPAVTEPAPEDQKETDYTELPSKEETVESSRELSGFSYAIVEEDGYLTVYEKDLRTVFLYTGIPFRSLPEDLKEEILRGKLFKTESDLYLFLENYSS